MDYVVLDIETTGGAFNEERIIEIAAYRFNGEEITDQFISLINPQKDIYAFVQKLTGITNKMVRTAPKFHEIARRLIEITQNSVIVAHNAEFDYRVIQREYSLLGYNFVAPTLDTIILSKKLLPEEESYSLGKLCKSLGIPIINRHRANGDALATVKLLQILLLKDIDKEIVKSLIEDINHKKILYNIAKFPMQVGIFYLYDKDDTIIYLAKEMNIQNGIRKFFANSENMDIIKKTESITYELTGSWLIASIKEKEEIQIYKSVFKKKTRKRNHYVIKKSKNALYIEKAEKCFSLLTFSSLKKANFFINTYHNLFTNSESFRSFPLFLLMNHELLLLDKGRVIGEYSFVYIKNNVSRGYGYYTLHSQIDSKKKIKKIMRAINSEDHDIQAVLTNRILKNPQKLVVLN